MSSNFLEPSEVDILVDLLRRSQRAKAREALCRKIGIKTEQLHFLREGSDDDFLTQLIGYLDDIGNQEAICNLCCKELLPIFRKSREADRLATIISKIDCCCNSEYQFQGTPFKSGQESLAKPKEKLPKMILISTAAIISSSLIVGIKWAGEHSKHDPIAIPAHSTSQGSTYPKTCENISINEDVLSAQCRKIDGSLNSTSIKLEGIENINGILEFHGLGKASTYQNTCNNISINRDVLSAQCRKRDGSLNSTSIKLEGIENTSGSLQY
ncbi:CVNH domain-containing protein [Microcoleus sp. S36b_A4]|uniref:mannose-binding lectin n=1 Tax=Microcoleus sp. S36b_A4 TaxID=3055420 RepID=UPI002FD5757A